MGIYKHVSRLKKNKTHLFLTLQIVPPSLCPVGTIFMMSRSNTVLCYSLAALLVLTLAGSVRNGQLLGDGEDNLPAMKTKGRRSCEVWRGKQMMERPCEEIYMVEEGETLHSISDKCGDPFIVERNPHIHDPDDVFPGLLIKIQINLPTS
ncbi:unnamed protein product [Brassica oleracea var. botrytis]|uniref:LysM domain-containing protein n=1 Tax=Brassica oleracea TaxID=3712 RepID=A0A3P6FA69_BRAOL|nr:unnamed protein product [Brassica oleracea]